MLEPYLQQRSEELAAELAIVFAAEPADDGADFELARVAASLAVEHWLASLALLSSGLLSAAAVVHRAQYEAVLRSVWIRYSASEVQLEKLAQVVNTQTSQAAQSLASSSEMMKAIEHDAPRPLVIALQTFRDNSWKSLNSYAHAGLHAIRHHDVGYPAYLFEGTAKNSNGLAMLGAMHVASLTEDEALMKHTHSLQFKYANCFAPK
ncbi:MAG: hypothetical protein IV094_01285 [Vitreoscilla sp.]|nr:hypothetical protein [Vitreoscilla sp.]